MQTRQEFSETMPVNDVIRHFADTVAVFNEFGIDACCGGAASVVEAARRDGADPVALVAALREVVEAAS